MSRKKQRHQRKRARKVFKGISAFALLPLPLFFLFVVSGFVKNAVIAYHTPIVMPEQSTYLDSSDLKQYVTDFFTQNGAEELIPIIECESEFKHFDTNGSVLRNRQGSSAIGIAQIMSSMHPDPQVIKRYNRRHKEDVSIDNFDITSLTGNLQYALVLYKVRGTKDWECAKKI